MQVIWNELQEAGYKRIGMALKLSADSRVDGGFGAQYLWLSAPYIGVPEIPIFQFTTDESKSEDQTRLANWLERNHPDAIITNDGTLVRNLNRLGWPVPQKIGVALTNVEEGNDFYTGVVQANKQLGSTAIDVLAAHLHHQGFSSGECSTSTQVKGIWKQGKTTRKPENPRK